MSLHERSSEASTRPEWHVIRSMALGDTIQEPEDHVQVCPPKLDDLSDPVRVRPPGVRDTACRETRNPRDRARASVVPRASVVVLPVWGPTDLEVTRR